MRRLWILMLILLLLAAHLNLTGLVPLQIGDEPPPWWVGGRLLWPFAEETDTLLSGDTVDTLTPMLSIASGLCFLLAVAALLRWRVPSRWFTWSIVVGVVLSVVLQVIWFTEWAVLPLLVDVILLWAVFGRRVTVDSLRGSATRG